jgi:hypothetical protein
MRAGHPCAVPAAPMLPKMARGPACCAEPLIHRYQPACKPGSVGHRPLARTIRDGHSSGTTFARCLEQPTRTASLTSPCGVIALQRTLRVAVPIRSCSRCGLPCRLRCRSRGALLPHLFTLASSEEKAVRSLWHFPWGRPRRTLSGTVCRWSPDFPLPQPFDLAGAAVRPTDVAVMGAWGDHVKSLRPAPAVKINYPEDVVLRWARSTGCWRSRHQRE